MRYITLLISFTLLFVHFACSPLTTTSNAAEVIVENTLDFKRREVVAIPRAELLAVFAEDTWPYLRIKTQTADNYQLTQQIDYDKDGQVDEYLFLAEVDAGKTKVYTIVIDSAAVEVPYEGETYSRFVPERTDDYTWENDRVAFRTYGPEAQRLVEAAEPGGTLSSGIDLWLKRVKYSIINDWYAKNQDSIGYYHIDHGEGYDPYHVGKSRGTGGVGVWENDSLYTSRNFTAYRTLAEGPLRTVFELDYAPWSKYNLQETKRISLDLGSNFSRFEIHFEGESTPPNYTVGITLHEGKGQTRLEEEKGWVRHWETIDGAQLGEGLVMDPNRMQRAFVRKSDTPDQSQLLVLTDPEMLPLTYYAGFAWEKSGQVSTLADWDLLLEQQAAKLGTPLVVTLNKK